MGRRVAFVEVVRIVGRDQRDVQLAGDLDQALVDDLFFRHPVTHHFDVEAISEDLFEDLRVLLRGRVVVLEQGRGDQTGHAARKDDEALVVLGQQVQIDPGLIVVALQEALGDERGQIPVADQIGRQQGDVGLVADRPVEPAARSDVGLASDDRGQLMVAGLVVELHRAVHDAVIGQRDRPGAALIRALAERFDAACPVQQRVLGMDVEVDELTHGPLKIGERLKKCGKRDVTLNDGF